MNIAELETRKSQLESDLAGLDEAPELKAYVQGRLDEVDFNLNRAKYNQDLPKWLKQIDKERV